MSNSATQRWDADSEELSRQLQAIPAAMRSEILELACGAAGQPIKEKARQFAPVRTGALQASIDIKTLSDPQKGTGAALIGPDRNYYRGGKAAGDGDDLRGADRPANYAHLVEFGHVAVAPLVTVKKGKKKKVKAVVEVGFVAPKPFMRPGFIAGAPLAEKILVREINYGIARVPGVKVA